MAEFPQQFETIESDLHTDEMIVNMGPQHPSTHGVLRLALRTDGEVVTEAIPQIGYLHRCAEKIGEKITPRQFIPYTDRLDYLAGMNMNLGWALTVEKLLGVEATEKCRHLRVIVTEMNRIASPLGRRLHVRSRLRKFYRRLRGRSASASIFSTCSKSFAGRG